eukprot:289367_1
MLLPTFHIMEGCGGIIWLTTCQGIQTSLGLTNGWKDEQYQQLAVLESKIMDIGHQIDSVNCVYDTYKNKEDCVITVDHYEQNVQDLYLQLDETQAEILQLCQNNPKVDIYKGWIKEAKLYGVSDHNYKACSIQGKTAINMKESIHQLTKYIRDNIDLSLSNDYYEIIHAFKGLTDIMCKKCDGKPKSKNTVN